MNMHSRSSRVFWYALFMLVIALSLWVPLYNRAQPTLVGIPFFYWFQFGWIALSAVVTALAYRAGF
ncbi:MAG: DUF3311 domain-containing protein [Rhodanobacteraceae bacterium]